MRDEKLEITTSKLLYGVKRETKPEPMQYRKSFNSILALTF